MGDYLMKAEEFEKKADKKLTGWGLFRAKYDDAEMLLENAANFYKLAKSWDLAGKAYVKRANCFLKDLDPTFSGTRECKFLTNIAGAIDEELEDVAKFTDIVKEFDSLTPLDTWKTTLLLRVKEKLKAMELEEDDLN